MIIRPYKDSDLEGVKKVCHETTIKGFENKQTLITTLYVNYYVEKEPEHCFVLADDEDNVVGYILCAADYMKYREIWFKEYAPLIKKKYPIEVLSKKLELMFFKKVIKTCPAHLHIDIIEPYQKGGWGKKLINTLLEKLKSDGVPGIFLATYHKNKNARGFYEHLGFKKSGTIMGLSIIYSLLI